MRVSMVLKVLLRESLDFFLTLKVRNVEIVRVQTQQLTKDVVHLRVLREPLVIIRRRQNLNREQR